MACRYWNATRKAMDSDFPIPQEGDLPSVRDYTQCMEVDSHIFFR